MNRLPSPQIHKTLQLSFLFLLFYLPFQVALNPAPGIDLASARVFIIILFLWWLASGLKNKSLDIPLQPQTLLLLLFLWGASFSLIRAENLWWGMRKVLVFGSIFPLFFVGCWFFKKKGSIKKTFKILFASGVLAGILGIIQFVVQFWVDKRTLIAFWGQKIAPFFWGTSFGQAVYENPSWLVSLGGRNYFRAFATFPDPHMFSFFLGMVLPLGIIFFANKKIKPAKKIILVIGYLLLVSGLTLSFSRGGYLGLGASIMVMIALSWTTIKPKFKKVILTSLILVIIIGFAATPIRARFLSTFNLQEKGVAGRIEIWQDALRIFSQHPWLGVGIGNYAYFINPAASYRFPIYAHNTYLDIAVEMGMFTLLVWLLLLGSSLSNAVFSFFQSKNKETKLASLALAGSLTYFAVHSLVETPIYSPRILPLLVVLIAVSTTLKH